MRTSQIFLSALLCTLATLATLPVDAHTIVLKNGNSIEGTVVEGTDSDADHVVVRVGDFGTMTFRKSEIAEIRGTPSDSDSLDDLLTTPATAREYVEVQLKETTYGDGVFYGVVGKGSNERELVLEVPEAGGSGHITIPRNAIARTTPVSSDSAGLAPAAARSDSDVDTQPTEISTTHVVHLKNGRQIKGNLIQTADDEPLKLAVGSMGVLLFARDKVANVEAKDGTYSLPKRTHVLDEMIDEPLPETDASAGGDVEALKDAIKAELLEELLDDLIEKKLETATRGVRRAATRLADVERISGDELLELQEAVRELGRHRTRNRVRAERKLKTFGPAAIPYLRPIVHHPFNLTRRAVQRIVRDLGAVEGAPLAMDALNDEDDDVRLLAGEALSALLPDVRVGYRSTDPEAHRLRAQTEYWAAWDLLTLEAAKAQVLESLATR